MILDVKKALKNSIFDGLFANMFATLTGGVFLTGFALYLGMSDLVIGFLGAVPFLVTVFQLPASYWVGRHASRKTIAFKGAAVARFIWLPILAVALMPFWAHATKGLLFVGLFLLAHICISISYVAWQSWTADLVPAATMGRFFGTRNMFCGLGGMAAMLVFGNLMDFLKKHFARGLTLGFGITFVAAVVFGMLSLYFMRRIPDIAGSRTAAPGSVKGLIRLPFKDPNFRSFLSFNFFWSFAVYFSSPFFTLYFLRYLQFSYGFVAVLGILSGTADLVGMQFWGRISDRVRNRSVIQLSSWFVIFLPLLWVSVSPGDIVIPLLLHFAGGGFWAGINLCTNNLLLRISPRENKAFYMSAYNIAGGMGAALAPVTAGLLLSALAGVKLEVAGRQFVPIQLIFLLSTLLRLLSFQFFKAVREPQEVPVGQLIRILRGVRGLNVATGFNQLLHPFVEIAPPEEEQP